MGSKSLHQPTLTRQGATSGIETEPIKAWTPGLGT